MKKTTLFLGFLTLISSGFFAQSKVSGNDTETNVYSKNALTVIILDNNGAYISDLKNATHSIILPEKYDANKIEFPFLSAASTPYAIQQKIDEQKIANQIIAKCYGRDDKTGQFDVELIVKRGIYKGNADEMIKAAASKLALAKTKNAGVQLISNSYIQVIDLRNIVSMEAFYNSEDANNQAIATEKKKAFKPIERNKNGWKGEMVSYLYRINSSAIDTLYEKLWIFEDDNAAVKTVKRAAYDKTEFETSFVLAVDGYIEASQYNAGNTLAPKAQLSKEELFSKLINTSVTNALKEIENQFEPFKIITSISSTHPIIAKIGKKEGLYVDQSFFVIEKVENDKGEIVSRHHSVIRACKVADNIESENATSKFYQTSGSKIKAGMPIRQRNEIGLGISLGQINSNEMGGGYLKLEENLSVLSNLICKNKSHFCIPQLKLFTSLALDQADYNINNVDTAYSFKRFQVGLSKGFHFARYFSVAPFVAIGLESAKLTDSKNGNNFNTSFLNYGASASVCISHNAQIILTLNNYNLLKQASGIDVPTGFANRKGLTYDFGLRIEL